MKKLVQVLMIIFCSFVIFTSSAVADVDSSVKTKWTNQRGSTLDLIIDSEKVSGTFTTKVGCGIGIPRKVIGTRSKNKNAISFIVNFEECESITAWNGYFDNAENPTEISTQWLYVNAKDSSNFKSTSIGCDTFKHAGE